jgi:putative aminopeptidase FrvX
MQLLKELCEIFGPSGDELAVRDFIVKYVNKNKGGWKAEPELIYGEDFQNCLILKFGNPRTAVFAHLDSHGYTVRYEDQLVPIGGPEAHSGCKLVGEDILSKIECELLLDKKNRVRYKFGRPIKTGTQLVFKCDFIETEETVQSCYLDNRLGVYVALMLASELEDGLIVFSCWEEHGGGSVPFLTRHIYERYKIRQALVCDITWITDGVRPGEGVAISLRDYSIPRKQYLNRILKFAEASGIPYQLEVEGNGSSDGREIQHSPYPIDWCFIGAAEENVHSPEELVHKSDIKSMISMYEYLMQAL